MTTSKPLFWAKWILYVVGVLAPIALVIFPNFFVFPEDRIKVVVSLLGFLVLGLVFALEDIKLVFWERHNQLVEKMDLLQKSFQDDSIHRSMRKIEESGDLFFSKHASDSVRFLRERLRQAELGVLKLEESELATFPLELADSVRKSLLATSVWNDDPLASHKRINYLEKLAVAHRSRGVRVMRLFIISPGDEKSDAFKKRLEQEKARGFENRYMTADEWIKTNHVPKPIDFGVWDESRVWIYTGDKLPSMRHKAELHNARTAVDAYRSAFDINWAEATAVG
jgi:hypothetical protein